MPILDFVGQLLWPAVIILLVLFFREEIRQVAGRLQEARLPGRVAAMFADNVPHPSSPKPDETPGWTPAERRLGRKADRTVEANWQNSGNVFWLRKDLTDAVYALRLGAEKRLVLFILNQCRHHVRSLNFSDKHFDESLTATIQPVEHRPEAEFNKEMREKLAEDMILISNEIGAHMEAHQPGFEGWPT